MGALANAIASLQDMLAAVLRERDEIKVHLDQLRRHHLAAERRANEWMNRAEIAEKTHARAYNAASIEIVTLRHERDAALADLSQARAELLEARTVQPANWVQREKYDAEVKAREEAEASAAAMRERGQCPAMMPVTHARCVLSYGHPGACKDKSPGSPFATDAGRVLLERHAAELAKVSKENALLKEAALLLHPSCVEAEERNQRDSALLGKAVAVLERAKDHVELPMDIDHGLELEINAIITDSTATAAADAYRVQQEERHCRCHKPNVADSPFCINCKRPVNARRGGGR